MRVRQRLCVNAISTLSGHRVEFSLQFYSRPTLLGQVKTRIGERIVRCELICGHFVGRLRVDRHGAHIVGVRSCPVWRLIAKVRHDLVSFLTGAGRGRFTKRDDLRKQAALVSLIGCIRLRNFAQRRN